MFCHNCGTQIEEGAEFCHICGTKVVYGNVTPQMQDCLQNTDSVQPEAVFSEESDSANEPEGEGAGQVQANADLVKEEPDSKEESSKSDGWWDKCSNIEKVLIVSGILLGGGLVLYFLILFLRKFGALIAGILVVIAIIWTLFTGSEKEKKEVKKAILSISGFFIIFIIIMIMDKNPNFIANIFQPGAGVRNAYLTQYSEEVTIEDAFESFFDNGKWSTYKDKEYLYVVFTGSCVYLGERADVKVRFKLTGENFIVDSLDLNGQEQNDLILYGLLTAVYEGY